MTVIIILLQLATVLLTAYFTIYVSQKGKNLAVKSDLKDLTIIVEEVKKKYQDDNEWLKSELNILADKKSQVFTEEKMALILFFTSLNEWIWANCNIPIYDYDHSNLNDLSDKIISLKNQQNQVNISFSGVLLLVDNLKLIEQGNKVINETSRLHQFVESNSTSLKQSLSAEKSVIELFLSEKFNAHNPSKLLSDFIAEEAEKSKKNIERVKEGYWDKHSELFKPVIKERQVFLDIAKQHLKS